MDFSPPSPASSSADSQQSYSHFLSSNLGLDPSDPLNLLLHNTSQPNAADSSMDESSCEGGSPPDWSQLSALWPENDLGQAKPYSDAMDFSELTSLYMDMDFNPSMAIEPSALHFNPMKLNLNVHTGYPYGDHSAYTNELLTPQFPFTFQPPYNNNELSSNPSPQPPEHYQRRLSVTSSSSSSGASFSPAPESAPSPAAIAQAQAPELIQSLPNDTASAYSDDPAEKLAQRVRQSAGVMLAIPTNAHLPGAEVSQQIATPVSNGPTTAPKLPIPRLPRHMPQLNKSNSTVSSAASTPPPSTPSPPPSTTPVLSSSSAPQAPGLPRPKTSHTTIERRYRTNLNARIQSLRMAVPALRVVEDREGGKKRAPNKVLVSNDGIKLEGQDVVSSGGIIDVIDERGFVDGVKVARKCSKANVLGKAVEYIRVLKKRELRLKSEQMGLKSLISGLVGGPALLREWEREWKENFGGEERDEVDGEMEAEVDDDDSEDEDDGEEEGRKRKRNKTLGPGVTKEKAKKPSLQEQNNAVPEKRKRGRPRKIVTPAASPNVQDYKMEPPITAQSGPSLQSTEQGAPQQYLLAAFALFSFFNSPLTSPSPSSPHTHSGKVLNAPITVGQESWGMTQYIQMFHLLVSVVVLWSFISSWIGFSFGGQSLLSFSWRHGSRNGRKTRADWVTMGEECVLAGPKQDIPLYKRIQIYHNVSSWPGASVQQLSTAAMVMYGAQSIFGGLARMKARSAWNITAARNGATAHEKMVLEGMSVDEGFERLSQSPNKTSGETPMQILASALMKERVRKHLGRLFVRSTRTSAEEDQDGADTELLEKDMAEMRATIDAAKELGGSDGELGRKLERVWKLGVDCQVDVEDARNDESDVDGEIKALLTAVILYRRLFSSSMCNGASTLLSPPPSPGRKDTTEAGMLRRALGSRVFEGWNELEDARDRAVDMVVELERRSVGLE